MSRLALGDYDKCEADLVTAARLEPGNRCDSDLMMICCESDDLEAFLFVLRAVQEQLGLARDRRRTEKKNLAAKMQLMFTKS